MSKTYIDKPYQTFDTVYELVEYQNIPCSNTRQKFFPLRSEWKTMKAANILLPPLIILLIIIINDNNNNINDINDNQY